MSNVQYTPMVKQYLDVKNEHPNELLFFRLGDFYELFFDDAIIASRELNITLTGRAGGLEERIPMCGVPYHSVEGYIAKLIQKGYRIAICEQVEDPKVAKGIVKREVIKIITPGTALTEQLLEDNANRFLASLLQLNTDVCVTFVDVTTGECLWFYATGAESEDAVFEQITRLQPAEIILPQTADYKEKYIKRLEQCLPKCLVTCFDEVAGTEYCHAHFGDTKNLPSLVLQTVELMLNYLHETVKADLGNINVLNKIAKEEFMNLDFAAIRNLELIKNMRDGSKAGTLLGVLDYTSTNMGARKLRQWIECPLLDVPSIINRQDAVESLLINVSMREALLDNLKQIADLERIMARIELGTANARDLVALRNSLAVLPVIKEILDHDKAKLLQQNSADMSAHLDIFELLNKAIIDEPPVSIREGGMIKTGYHKELDELHSIAKDNKIWLRDFEIKVKESTGIKNLKVNYNKVFGYYIEVSKGSIGLVPDYFIRKQTLVNAERYIIPELKEYENKILSAKEKIQELEYFLFTEIKDFIRKQIVSVQNTAKAISNIDALLSLALVAFKNNYVRPELNNKQEIIIKDGRHPVIEQLLKREIFVPNDTLLDNDEQKIIVITGPNMAGKSTYMRQVALLVLMTQLGAFIPARSANICPVDKIFTRVGASDDLATGQSTFMMEMNEVAQILKYATANSLIILDEVGRGTSTFDGMSIAKAVVEYISKNIKAKTLFATHYHQLIELEAELHGVKNYSVAVKERGQEIAFLRRIIPGGTDKSYGIHVAELAGLPKKMINRAKEILQEYDAQNNIKQSALPTLETKSTIRETQFSLFDNSLNKRLLELDLMTMTPLEALNELYKLQEEAKKEGGRN
ncbi:MAG TPA: DNA mismatch repair protein MutS [Candidatus Avacidaminococcus intestinavium]|uniref:DNA mismatch repair protein MutS n=1 Tax=Candidatus Avacidaminococcus intestinavium TaxID=2840684 RepID=A0A9D1SLJ7_9FIRM|nr:DNA mismatch repair protein MutS [Candidatus Avacidaminococcus intestinavium]